MTIPCKSERSVLSHDEYAVVLKSHHPLIYDTGTEELKEARRRLREMRDRERTLARAKRREARGKQKGRGASFPGTEEHPTRRKQVFAGALKRINREIDRLEKLEARAAHVAGAKQALAIRRAAQFPPRPPGGDTANEGMQSLPSRRRRVVLPPAKIGRVSQANKAAQAARDSRR
ncbi:MAG: hypothetical protein ACXWVB_10245 [Rhodoplanes sp.]|jgi:hypothetical protein